MLGSSQHHVFQRFVVVQSALSKLQKPWRQGSHFSSTSPELWGSVLALGILFPDHQGSQTGELVGPAWVVPVPRLQMPMQNLALLLDVSARKNKATHETTSCQQSLQPYPDPCNAASQSQKSPM